jgi:hypothetical protein
VNDRDRVRQALLCRKPDKIPKALGFFDRSLGTIAPPRPEDYFNLDVRFAEFDPPDNQDEFRRYMVQLPADIHVGSRSKVRTYHEWQYHPEKGTARPLSSIRPVFLFNRRLTPTAADVAVECRGIKLQGI